MKLKRKIFNIFAAVVMMIGSVPMNFASVYAEEAPGEAPKSLKTVKSNNDGTYDITLEIEGVSSNKTDATKANVVIIYDTSNSMTYSIGNGSSTSRLDVANSALNTLAEELFKQNKPEDENLKDMVEVTFLDFAENVKTKHTTPTTSLTEFQGWIPTTTTAGTNWEAALAAADAMTFGDNDKTYVIFISDGSPTYRDSKYSDSARDCRWNKTCPPDAWGTGTGDPNDWNYNAAKVIADRIVNNASKEFYSIGAFGDVGNMQGLGGTYYSANDETSLKRAFDEIVSKITMGLSVADLQIEDGITAATSAEIKGTAGHFRYSVPESWGNDYAQATFSGGSVHWNPGHDKTLTNGEKASVTFTVWPSQEAMDCIAAIRNDNGCTIADADLATYGLGKNTNGSYKLLTNSTATFQYRTATKVEGTNQTTYSALSDEVNFTEKRDDTTLPETTVKVTKSWMDGMDPAQRDDITEVSLELYVDKATNPDPVRKYTFNKNSQQGNEWLGVDEDGKSVFTVAPGVMKKLDGTAATEGLRDLGEIVRVGNDEYVVLEKGHDYEFDNETVQLINGGSNHYHITKRIYHPMIIGEGGQIHDVMFSEDGKTAVIEKTPLTKLTAENTLNGGIMVGKNVINNNVKDTTITDKYEITITLRGADTGQYRIYTYNQDGSVASRSDKINYTGGKITEKIQVNQKIMVTDVPTGVTFDVTETLPEGYIRNEVTYEVVKYDGTDNVAGVHEVFGNASSTATVTNYLESGDLKISKTVTATSGNLAQAQNQTFDVTVNFYKHEGEKTPVRTETLTIKHGETKTIENIPVDWYYEVIEAAKAGFNNGAVTTKTGTITSDENKVELKNNYAVTPLNDVDAKIVATKAFASGYEAFWLSTDQFVFVMTGNGETKEAEPVNLAHDTAEFIANITDEGTYVYTITEKTTNTNGSSAFRPGVSRLENDADIVVTIVVTDNNDGTLKLVSKTYSKESKKIYNKYEATNTYGEGETEGALKFNKVLEGRDWEDFDEYTFTIESEDGPLPETTTLKAKKGQTEFDFGVIKFTNKDVNKTYNYVVRESFDATKMKNVAQSTETAGGISFTIKVTDNLDGTLNLEVSDYKHTFKNIYTPDEVTTGESELTNTLFTIYKVVEDKNQRFGGEEFVFEITGEGFDKKTVKINTATTGSQMMDGVYTFTETGTYTFKVKEIAGNNQEMGYDKTEYTVEIVVVDNPAEGKLEIASAKIDGQAVSDENKLLFTNKYEPELYNETGDLTVKKIWNGGLEWQNEVSILLKAKADGKQLWQRPATITAANDWSVTFTGLYKYENGATIEYSVEETGIAGADTLTFIVYGEDETEDGEKAIVGQWVAAKNGFEITNTWNEATNDYIYNGATEFTIAKVDEDGAALAGVKFDVNGATVTTDQAGRATVKVPVKADATKDSLQYTIKETETLDGYDKYEGEVQIAVNCAVTLTGIDATMLKNTYTKTCELKKSGSSEYSWNGNQLTLTLVNNRSLADSLTIRKETTGITEQALIENGLTFTVTGPSDFTTQTIGFDQFTKVNDGVYEYRLTGRVPTGEYTVVEAGAEFKDLLNLSVSGENNLAKKVNSGDKAVFTIKNSYEKIRDRSFTVAKVWSDDNNRDHKRPGELAITLLRDNKPYRTTTLSDGAGWSYTWTDLPRAGEDAKEYVYSATEATVSDYESDGGKLVDGVLTFTNTYEPELYHETGKLTVEKKWANADDRLESRGEVVVELVAKVNGGEIWRKPATIFEQDGVWTYTFDGLFVYENGETIEYSVEEKSMLGVDLQDGSVIVYGAEELNDGTKSVEGRWVSSVDGATVTNTWEDAKTVYGGQTEFYIYKIEEDAEPMDGVVFTINGDDYVTKDGGVIRVEIPETNVREDKYEFEIVEKSTREGYDLITGKSTVKVSSVSNLVSVDAETMTNVYEKEFSFEVVTADGYAWDGRNTLIVTNNRSLASSLTIRKVVEGIEIEKLLDGDLMFEITGPDKYFEGGFVAIDEFEIEGNEAVFTLVNVPTGEYVITELDASIAGYNLITSGDNGVAKSVEKNGDVVFTITNQYRKIDPCADGEGCGRAPVTPETPDTGAMTDSARGGAMVESSLLGGGLMIMLGVLILGMKKATSRRERGVDRS